MQKIRDPQEYFRATCSELPGLEGFGAEYGNILCPEYMWIVLETLNRNCLVQIEA